MFSTSEEWQAVEDVQSLINRGLFYTLTRKTTGEALSYHHTLADAMRAKTRKSRIVLTRHLLIKKVRTNGKNESNGAK